MKKKIIITILVLFSLFFGAIQVLGAEIFGDTTIGSANSESWKWGLKAYLSVEGEINKISVYTASTIAGNGQTAIYDEAGNLKGVSEEIAITSTLGWVDFNFSPTIVLDEGWYWIMIKSDGNLTYYVHTRTLAGVSTGKVYGYDFPATITPTIIADTSMSIYATYELVGPFCDSEHLELCLTEIDCENAGGYWYNEICNVLPPPPPPPVSWLPFTDTYIGGIIGYMRGWLGSGIFPLLAVFIGIPFAFVILKKVIKLVPKK